MKVNIITSISANLFNPVKSKIKILQIIKISLILGKTKPAYFLALYRAISIPASITGPIP